MSDKRKRVYVESYGCQMNVYDSRAMLDRLRDEGYEEVKRPEDAGVLLMNTCAVRDNADGAVSTRSLSRATASADEKEGTRKAIRRARPSRASTSSTTPRPLPVGATSTWDRRV